MEICRFVIVAAPAADEEDARSVALVVFDGDLLAVFVLAAEEALAEFAIVVAAAGRTGLGRVA